MKGLRLAVIAAVVAGTLALTGTVEARWTELPSGARVAVAKSVMTVAPPPRWNMSSFRDAKKSEMWSYDGPLLNRVDFFGAIASGEPLARERNKKRNPIPKFSANMQPSDVAELYERTSRIVANTNDFTVDTVAPATFAGRKGFRFSFHYTGTDDTLTRRGLATGAVIGGKLYLVTFTAPSVHYYDAGLADAQAIMDSAQIS